MLLLFFGAKPSFGAVTFDRVDKKKNWKWQKEFQL